MPSPHRSTKPRPRAPLPHLAVRGANDLTARQVAAAVRPETSLTRRELQVLEQVAVGLSNREIGNRLGVREQTVKKHMSKLLRKLSLSDRTRAVLVALRSGWIRLLDAALAPGSRRDASPPVEAGRRPARTERYVRGTWAGLRATLAALAPVRCARCRTVIDADDTYCRACKLLDRGLGRHGQGVDRRPG